MLRVALAAIVPLLVLLQCLPASAHMTLSQEQLERVEKLLQPLQDNDNLLELDANDRVSVMGSKPLHSSCKRKRQCESNMCFPARRRAEKRWCLAKQHSLGVGEVCFRDKECRSRRCVKPVGECEKQISRLFTYCTGNFGRCGHPRGTVGAGDACYVDAECQSRHCRGDILFFRRYNRAKPRSDSETPRSVAEAQHDVNRPPGACMSKNERAGRFRRAMIEGIFDSVQKDFEHRKHTYRNSVAKGPEYEGKILGYYKVNALHDRLRPMRSTFVGHEEAVRVQFPKKTPPPGQSFMIDTDIGEVWGVDHLRELQSVEAFNAMPEMADRKKIVRLEMVGPARKDGAFFAAVTVFVGYCEGATTPSVFVGVAGTAAGKIYTPFFGENIQAHVWQTKNYSPTPFTKNKDTYHIWLDWDGNEPKKSNIVGYHAEELAPEDNQKPMKQKRAKPYVQVTGEYVKFTPKKRPRNKPWVTGEANSALAAYHNVLQAVIRVETIRHGLNILREKSKRMKETLLSKIARAIGMSKLVWKENPVINARKIKRGVKPADVDITTSDQTLPLMYKVGAEPSHQSKAVKQVAAKCEKSIVEAEGFKMTTMEILEHMSHDW